VNIHRIFTLFRAFAQVKLFGS